MSIWPSIPEFAKERIFYRIKNRALFKKRIR